MRYRNFLNHSALKNNSGFTLIELIIVIIILGILSVTVIPKLFSSKGFSEYAYRTDVIAKLRLIQTKAMQQTTEPLPPSIDKRCHQVLISTKKLGAPDNCGASPSFASDWKNSATKLQIDSNDNVSFSSNITDNNFFFDSMGRPSCNSCEITISGEQSLVVKVEPEGYIHAL